MPIDEFNEQFDTHLDETVADTVAGFVVRTLGRIPEEGDIIEAGNVRFQVVAMLENRIDWLSGERLAPAGTGAATDSDDR